MSKLPEMKPSQALGISLALIEYEIEEPAVLPLPPGWLNELRAARAIVADLLDRFSEPPQPVKEPPPEIRRRYRKRAPKNSGWYAKQKAA